MDIQHLVDRLEDLIDDGRHVPMSKFTLIDEEQVLSLIDQMRISVPEQIETASRVVNQRDRLIAQANEEASRIVEHARQKGEDMVQQDRIMVAAEHQANQVRERAQAEAERIRAEADNYVVEVLRELESHLLRTLTVVRNGIAKVNQDREAAQQMRRAGQAQVPQQAPVQMPAQMPITPVEPAQATMPVAQPEEVPVEVTADADSES